MSILFKKKHIIFFFSEAVFRNCLDPDFFAGSGSNEYGSETLLPGGRSDDNNCGGNRTLLLLVGVQRRRRWRQEHRRNVDDEQWTGHSGSEQSQQRNSAPLETAFSAAGARGSEEDQTSAREGGRRWQWWPCGPETEVPILQAVTQHEFCSGRIQLWADIGGAVLLPIPLSLGPLPSKFAFYHG